MMICTFFKLKFYHCIVVLNMPMAHGLFEGNNLKLLVRNRIKSNKYDASLEYDNELDDAGFTYPLGPISRYTALAGSGRALASRLL